MNKTKMMKIGNGNFDIELSTRTGIEIVEAGEVKFLGLHLDNKLIWSSEVNYIISRINAHTSLMYRLRYLFKHTSDVLRKITSAILFPIVDLFAVLYHTAPLRLLDKLEVSYRKLIRAILFITPADRIHNEVLYSAVKWMPLHDKRNLQCKLLMHKIMYNNLIITCKSAWQKVQDTHAYNVRNTSDYRTTHVYKQAGKNMIGYRLIKLWNEIPIELRQTEKYTLFAKSMVK